MLIVEAEPWIQGGHYPTLYTFVKYFENFRNKSKKQKSFHLLVMRGLTISGIGDIQGCGHRVLSGRMEVPGTCPERLVQGCDFGELQ